MALVVAELALPSGACVRSACLKCSIVWRCSRKSIGEARGGSTSQAPRTA